jgi:hypothetical protein
VNNDIQDDKYRDGADADKGRNILLVGMPVAGMFAAADTAPATTAWKTAGGADSIRKMTTANATNPKAVFSTANIKYTLDPVDDLVPGTYIIHTEYADGMVEHDGTVGSLLKRSTTWASPTTPSSSTRPTTARTPTASLPAW